MEDIFSIIQFLRQAVKTGASDEHLMVGHAPYLRINGFIKKVTSQPLTKEDIDNAILDIAPTSIRDKILTLCDVDFMYEIKGCSRFRINYNRQLGMPGLVIRNIPYEIPKLKELSLPDILGTLIEQHNGIILVTGPTTGAITAKVEEIRVNLKPVNKTVKGERFSIQLNEKIRPSDKLFKWVDSAELKNRKS